VSNDPADNSAPPPIIGQIAQRLHQIFDGLIVVAADEAPDEAGAEQRFLTRAYMALSLLHYAGASPEEAAAAITDGALDDGVDCILVNEATKTIILGQSKFSSNVNKGFKLNEFVRFRDGCKRVIRLQWDDRNANLHPHAPRVENLLKDIDTKVVLVVAHTSEQELSEDIARDLEHLLSEENKYGELMVFHEFTLKEAAETARSHVRPENIDVTVLLKNWGLREKPYKAAYGSVAGADVVAWYEAHDQRLFAENLRYAIEKSEVNDGIRATSRDDPEKFWYFNNGITAICDEIEKQPMGGNNTDTGVFDVKRISVINGAQTISSLAKAKGEGADLSEVSVHLRVISLTGTPENFSVEVTTANNTQNDLSPVDFVAADPNQDRIRREAAQLGLIYTFRRGEDEPGKTEGFTIRLATVAAACASGDLRLAVAAKRYIGGLWENTKREPYTRLFNEETSAAWLWGAVRTAFIVDDTLETASKELEGRERLTAVHANRFILFVVFEILELDRSSDDPLETISNVDISNITLAVLEYVIAGVNDKFPDAYPGNIFKNTERQAELLAVVRASMAEDQGEEG